MMVDSEPRPFAKVVNQMKDYYDSFLIHQLKAEPVVFNALSEYQRKVEKRVFCPPTTEELAKYAEAKVAWEFLQNYPGFYYEDAYLIEPKGKWETTYAETAEEYAERLKAMPPIAFKIINNRGDEID